MAERMLEIIVLESSYLRRIDYAISVTCTRICNDAVAVPKAVVRQISGKIMFLKKSLARYSYLPPNMVGWVYTCNILNSFPTPLRLKIIVRGVNTF